MNFVGGESFSGVSEVDVFEFFGGQIHELVFTEGEGVGGLVVDFLEVLGEDGESVLFVLGGSEGFVVFVSPSFEFLVNTFFLEKVGLGAFVGDHQRGGEQGESGD